MSSIVVAQGLALSDGLTSIVALGISHPTAEFELMFLVDMKHGKWELAYWIKRAEPFDALSSIIQLRLRIEKQKLAYGTAIYQKHISPSLLTHVRRLQFRNS